MAEEEFADIDWGALVAADGATIAGIAGAGGGGSENSVVNQNQSNHDVPENNMMHPQQSMMTMDPTPSMQQPADDIEALRSQILQLQKELHSKDEKITDIESSHSSFQMESSHRIKNAEEEAERKIHCMQEELRRVKVEADKYKGSWIRSKKRVAELERKTNRVSQDKQQNNVNLSAFGLPIDIETKRVTPNNISGNQEIDSYNHFVQTSGQQLFESDTNAVSGSKRKMTEQPPFVEVGLTTESSQSLVSQTLLQYESLRKHDTVVQRLARHLLMRDEMGCYSIAQVDKCPKQAASNCPVQTGTIERLLDRADDSRTHIRSILHQVLDIGGDVSELSDSVCKCESPSEIFFMILTKMVSLFDDTTKFDGNNSISVLYSLRVICDMLSLSAQTREDLRHWLYQSQQSAGNVYKQRRTSDLLAPAHSRIEGLPSPDQIKLPSKDSKEALWTGTCTATLIGEGHNWDPLTMSQPCKAFFRIIVSLIAGSSHDSFSFDLKSKVDMTQLIREQAIRSVLTLMSDAPQYSEASVGKTPYLWNFWLDSLFMTNSINDSDTEPTEKFENLFLCGVPNGRDRGWRKRCGRPMSQELTKSNKQKRSSNSTVYSCRHNDDIIEEEGILSVKVKCGIIQLFTQLVVSSSSVQAAIYQSNGDGSFPLARQALAAILDEVDCSVIPLLSTSMSKAPKEAVLNYLELSCTCNEFILALSRSEEGINMLRYQIRIVSADDKETHWSHSAISCMALVLSSTMTCADGIEQEEPNWATKLRPYLKKIAEQCIDFFKMLQTFACNNGMKTSSSKSKSPTFATLVSEQNMILLSCFQKFCTRECKNNSYSLCIGDEMKYDVQMMMEEILYGDV